MSKRRPLVVWTKRERSGVLVAVRASVRAHCHAPFAVTTPSSSWPSSGCACWKVFNPPNRLPTLPTSTQLARPLNHRLPPRLIFTFVGGTFTFLIAVKTYARRPARSLRPRSASPIMRASNPAPAMTAKCSPFTTPTSSWRRSPCKPIATASASRFGIPRLVASRFAVPAGRIATVASELASTPRLRCTIPSPPQTKTRSAPCSSACCTHFGARFDLSTSYHNGSDTPASARRSRSSSSPPSSVLRR